MSLMSFTYSINAGVQAQTQNGHCRRQVRCLRIISERAKRYLSKATQADIQLDALHEGVDFYISLTGGCFEKISENLFRRTLELVERALTDSKVDKSEDRSVWQAPYARQSRRARKSHIIMRQE